MSKLNLQEVEQNARQVFYRDGLMYLFLGFVLVFSGLSFYDDRFTIFVGLAMLLLFARNALRKRITYPRVGYVEFSMSKHSKRKKLGLMLIGALAVGMFSYWSNGRFPMMPIGYSVMMGLLLYYSASVKRGGIRLRDWSIILLALASAIVATYLFEDWHTATAIQMWFMATFLIVIGAVELIQFMRKHPVREVYPDATN